MKLLKILAVAISVLFLCAFLLFGSEASGLPRLGNSAPLLSSPTPNFEKPPAGGPFVSSRQKNADPRERLLQLYKAHRYFELHDALAEMKNDASPELDFFRAVAANTSNRLNEAIVGLLSYLQGGPTDTPRPRSSRNMLFFGFKPIVEVLHRGDRLSLCVDIGSSATFLYPPFFRRYGEDIKSRSKLREVTMDAVGDSRTVAVHILDEFAFRMAGRDVSLPKIMVHAEETHRESAYFDGVLGRDVLTQCSRMIFNFESMSFILE